MSRPTRSLKDVQHAVGERVKELPLHAARLTVTGIGHVLLLTDRLRKETEQVRKSGVGPALVRFRDDAARLVGRVADRVSGSPAAPGGSKIAASRPEHPAVAVEPAEPAKPAEPAPTPPVAAEPAAKPAEPAAQPAAEPATAKAEPTAEETTEPAAAKPKKQPATAASAPVPAAGDLPIPDYDERTVPSLRSRLRGLTAHQVALLRDYEQENQRRPEVVRMYENRIAKLTGEG